MKCTRLSAFMRAFLPCVLSMGFVVPGGLAETPPQWWSDRGVLTTNAANDYAALNLGQLKNLAYQTWLEMERLPGGAGFAPAFTNAANDYAAVTVGQLKETARPFYDRMGLTNNYPWTGLSNTADHAIANIGQAKYLFSFSLSVTDDGRKYLVIDLSGGPGATNFPVSYLADIPVGGWTDEHKTSRLVMKRIRAGTYLMGSPQNEIGREPDGCDETAHAVTLTKDFYIGVFEVTQRQWELVTGERPSYFRNDQFYAVRPVETVSYYDIREDPADCDDPAVDWPQNSEVNTNSFVGRLKMKAGLYTIDLPTEAQWEYACRAGTTTALNNGSDLTNSLQDANLSGIGRYYFDGGTNSEYCGPDAGTATVGSYAPNNWGLYDMHGNVNEWCLDWCGTYPGAVSDPAGAESDASYGCRVARGGGWGSYANACRSASRAGLPFMRSQHVGFRIARTVVLPGGVVVRFDAAGGTAEPSQKAVSCGAPYGALPSPVRSGYAFTGWWTTSGGAGTEVTESTVVPSAAADHTLHARWTANTYTVTFDACGGTVSPASLPVAFGSAYGSLPVPSQPGFTFCGWRTAAWGAGTAVTADTVLSAATDHTLYAKWAEAGPPEITFNYEQKVHWEARSGHDTFLETTPSKRYLKLVYEWSDIEFPPGFAPESDPIGIGPGSVTTEYDPRTYSWTITESGCGYFRGNRTAVSATEESGTCFIESYDDPPNEVDDEPGTQTGTATLSEEFTDELLRTILLEHMPALTCDWVESADRTYPCGLGEWHVYDQPSDPSAYLLRRGQYKFTFSPAAENATVSWCVAFVPDEDPAGVEYEKKTWTGSGAETPVYTIDPYQGGNGRYGTYEVFCVEPELDLEGVEDPVEATVGGYVPLNQDGGCGNLRCIALDFQPEYWLEAGTLTLEAVSGGNRIRIWKDWDKTEPVSLPLIWNIGADNLPTPAGYYVEGVEKSAAVNDVELRLRCSLGGAAWDDTVRLTVVNVEMAMDGDRDGEIDFDDPDDKHYLFWVNDDCDISHKNEGMWQEDDYGPEDSTHKDWDDAHIGSKGTPGEGACLRDLEDFTRLSVRVGESVAALGGVTYWLRFENAKGYPAVNIFEAADGTADYLSDIDKAAQQVKKLKLLTVLANNQDVQLDATKIKSDGTISPFLLEGRSEGTGDLTLVVKKGCAEICKQSVALELHDIAWFYDVWQARVLSGARWTVEMSSTARRDQTKSYQPETDEKLLFVHGWNMEGWEKRRWTETIFKRLWWQGYKGSVALFDWPTLDGFDVGLWPPSRWWDVSVDSRHFDNSEYISWKSGEALNNLITQLNVNGQLRVLAHSQGNVAMGEALRKYGGPPLHTYIASKAAVSAQYFDGSIAASQAAPFNLLALQACDTPDVMANYPFECSVVPYFSGVLSKAARRVNFFNVDDYALNSWKINNAYKPDALYSFGYTGSTNALEYLNGNGEFYRDPPLPLNRETLPLGFDETQRYRIFAYCGESRSVALGQTTTLPAGFTRSWDLQSEMGLNGAHYSHSREFRSNVVCEEKYWNKVFKVIIGQDN